MQLPESLAPIIECPTPENILFANSLEEEPHLISKEEFQERMGFVYTESIFGHRGTDVEFPDRELEVEIRSKLETEIQQYLIQPKQENLIIRFISPEVGYGLFTREKIEVGTIIGLYSGLLEPRHDEGQEGYGMSIQDTPYRINAKEFGGMTRFIQHMPFSMKRISHEIWTSAENIPHLIRHFEALEYYFDAAQLKTFSLGEQQVKANIKANLNLIENSQCAACEEMKLKGFLRRISNLATANTAQYVHLSNGNAICYVRAIRDIAPGEQLGLTYGMKYWNAKRIVPRYFNMRGEVIEKEAYLEPLASVMPRHKSARDTFSPTIETAFRRAAAKGNKKDVETFLEYGVDIDSQDGTATSRNTALHQAQKNGHDDIVELLLSWEADCQIENAVGEKVLDLLSPGMLEKFPQLANLRNLSRETAVMDHGSPSVARFGT